MLTRIIRALRWTDEKLENLLVDLAANYARDLLAAHGPVEIEFDRIRRNSKVESEVAPIESGEKITRFVPLNEDPLTQTRLEVIYAERLVPSDPGVPHRASTPNCDVWSGPEVVAALSIAIAAIVALLFCLTAIFKS
jgi:hypothetical protein